MKQFAAGCWFKPDYETLEKGSYLIEANKIHDVAYYEGKKPDGSAWWILSDITIDQKAITRIARILSEKE